MIAPPSRHVEIVGGGLAGLSLGLALRHAGAPVTIHEAGDYPRHRVCGEFITGLDDDLATRLHLTDALRDARSCAHMRWFSGGRTVHHQRLPRPGRAISRYILDTRLADAFVAAGGHLETGRRVDANDLPPGRVFAHGRRRHQSPWVGLKCHVRESTPQTDLELHLGRNAYVGVGPIEDGWANVCGLFHRRHVMRDGSLENTIPATLDAVGLTELATRVTNAERRAGSCCSVAGFSFDAQPIPDDDPDRLSLGDAAAMIPPFTGNGMALAFRSADLAFEPLLAWVHGETTWTDTVQAFRDRYRRAARVRLRTAAVVHPFLLRPSAQSLLRLLVRLHVVPTGQLYRLLH